MTAEDPTLDVQMGTEGIVLSMTIPAAAVCRLDRDRYLHMMEAIGILHETIAYEGIDGISDDDRGMLETVATMGASPPNPLPVPEPPTVDGDWDDVNDPHAGDDEGDEPDPSPEPPAPDPEAESVLAKDQELAERLVTWLKSHHGGCDDDDGFVVRVLAGELSEHQPAIKRAIVAAEAAGLLTAKRDGRRIYRVELTPEGQRA